MKPATTNAGSLMLRVPEADMQAHFRRMKRLGLRVLWLCGATVIVSQLTAAVVYVTGDESSRLVWIAPLGLCAPIAIAGIIIGVDAWRRSVRGLSGTGDLALSIEDRLISVGPRGSEPPIVRQPFLAGQAFADHIQIVVGAIPGTLHQVEVPVQGEQRIALLSAVGPLPERSSFSRHLTFVLCVFGPAIAVVLAALKALAVALEVAILLGLSSLPGQVGIAVLVGLAALGALVLLGRAIGRFLRS